MGGYEKDKLEGNGKNKYVEKNDDFGVKSTIFQWCLEIGGC